MNVVEFHLPNGYLDNTMFLELEDIKRRGPRLDTVYRFELKKRLPWHPRRWLDVMQLHGNFLLLRDLSHMPEYIRGEVKQLMEEAFLWYAPLLPGPRGRPTYVRVAHDHDTFQPRDFAQLRLAEAISQPL